MLFSGITKIIQIIIQSLLLQIIYLYTKYKWNIVWQISTEINSMPHCIQLVTLH